MNIDTKHYLLNRVSWLIILFGLWLRLDQFLFNRSLWLDEAFIAVNFIDKSLLQILYPPLDYSHSLIVPPGFLMVTKFAVTLLDNHDWVLRLFPFLCGVLSLLLFYQLAKIYISALAVPLALFFFASADSLIYYSSEFKQYSSDVTITIVLFLLLANLQTQDLTAKRLLWLGIVGAITVWFSHPAAFILATIGSYLLIYYVIRKQWQIVIYLSVICTFWLSNFIVLYLLFVGNNLAVSPIGQWLMEFWQISQGFIPSPFATEGKKWLYKSYLQMFVYPSSLGGARVASLLFIIGILALWQQRKGKLFLLILPFFIGVMAAYFQKYPFLGRMILFLTPAIYLILAEGIIQLKFVNYQKASGIIAQIFFVAVLFNYYPAKDRPFYAHRTAQEIKPVLEYVQIHQQNSDVIYLYHWAEPAFRYYAGSYGFNYNDCHLINPIPALSFVKEIDYFRSKYHFQPVDVKDTRCILGVSELFEQSQPDLEKLRGHGRVWFVFSHASEMEEKAFVNHLNAIGVPLDKFLQPGASTYLYQL